MGKTCQSFENALFEPEEELSEPEARRLSEHLETCASCRAERALFLESWLALEELDTDLEPSPMIRAKVWEQIREDEKQTPSLFEPPNLPDLRVPLMKFMVAGLALALGFGLGQGLRKKSEPVLAVNTSGSRVESQNDSFLDPALLELAAQDGYSVEIFPESKDFSPIDQEMVSALAPRDEARTWATTNRGAVVPIRYISRESVSP